MAIYQGGVIKVNSGKTFRKYLTAIAISPKKPRLISPSEMLIGIDCTP